MNKNLFNLIKDICEPLCPQCQTACLIKDARYYSIYNTKHFECPTCHMNIDTKYYVIYPIDKGISMNNSFLNLIKNKEAPICPECLNKADDHLIQYFKCEKCGINIDTLFSHIFIANRSILILFETDHKYLTIQIKQTNTYECVNMELTSSWQEIKNKINLLLAFA